MKLNKLLNKEASPSLLRETKIYNVNNDHREALLQAKVDELQIEIERLQSVEERFEGFQRHYHILEENIANLTTQNDTAEHENLILQQDNLYYLSQMKVLEGLKEQIKEGELELKQFKNRYYETSRLYQTAAQKLDDVTVQRDSLEAENSSLSTLAHKAEIDVVSMEADLTDIKKQYDNIESQFNVINKMYVENKRNVSVLKDEKAYWEKLAYSFQEELTEKESFSNQLREWIDVLQQKQSETNASVSYSTKQNTQLETVITDLTKALNDSLEEQEYLAQVNDSLKYQLSKAGHASMGAIAKKEGFKMPIATTALNWNKNYLGTSRPTLLKFKHREE